MAATSGDLHRPDDAVRRRHTDQRHAALLQSQESHYGGAHEKHGHARQRFV